MKILMQVYFNAILRQLSKAFLKQCCTFNFFYCYLSNNITLGIIHLVRTKIFPKDYHFLPLDRPRMYAYQGAGDVSFSNICIRTKRMVP